SREPPSAKHDAQAKELLVADEKSQGSHAQNVRDTFPKGDYFVNSRKDLQKQVKRFVELVFGEPFTTPTEDEYNMFLAKSASYRTADLSRQVGAVIIDKSGAVAGTGCNEVPYPGGGFFVEGKKGGIGDNRDFVKQIDPNYAEIQRSLIELIRILRRAGYIGDNKSDFKGDVDLVDALLQGHHKELMSNARIRNLIEFGRIVHAEMHALCDAAASGRSISGGRLYCTTFPCHGCARHLIAAGIREVVYIEPYPKSLSLKLYENEIELAHEEAENCDPNGPFDKVKFRPFHGTSPVLFQRVFQFRKRKDNRGIVASWVPSEAFPSGASLTVERPKKEASAANKVAEVLERAKVQLGTIGREASDDVTDTTATDR
ncbi:MAG: deaminase, partial [Sphingorhabdus sp.]|uniref:deaminase n=1 Tax=Sphingorhabdus sp. TaxID=1902408 RepID=UPI003C929BD2